jgi:hypothetical protein
MLSAVKLNVSYTECNYYIYNAESHYAECRFAECRGTMAIEWPRFKWSSDLMRNSKGLASVKDGMMKMMTKMMPGVILENATKGVGILRKKYRNVLTRF